MGGTQPKLGGARLERHFRRHTVTNCGVCPTLMVFKKSTNLSRVPYQSVSCFCARIPSSPHKHGVVSNLRTPMIITDWSPSNILFLPFRRTHSVQLSAAIRQYISTKYDQHPDMFTQDLDAINKLRAEAVNTLEAHVSGIKKLTSYAAQLVFMGGKFPIDVSRS